MGRCEMTNISEVDAIKSVNDALSNLDPSEQARVLNWAIAKFTPTIPIPSSVPSVNLESQVNKSPDQSVPPITKPKTSKKSKSVLKQIKELNLHPDGKESASVFCSKKSPTNVKQKCVVSVYYLRDIVGLDKVSVDHVYTFFKSVGWPVPSDLPNTLQQAGTAGWLDTSDGQAILITTTGENLVEHQLPTKSTK